MQTYIDGQRENEMNKREQLIDRLAHVLIMVPEFMVDLVDDTIAYLDTEVAGWVSVEDSMPPERETVFRKLKGTDKWKDAMFERMSDDVRIVIELEDGTRKVHHSYTVDGKWDIEKHRPLPCRVLYWMPNPPLPEE